MHSASLAVLPAPQVSHAPPALLPVPHPPASPTAHRKKSRQISSNTTQYVDLLAVPVWDSYLQQRGRGRGKRAHLSASSSRWPCVELALCLTCSVLCMQPPAHCTFGCEPSVRSSAAAHRLISW